MVSHTNEWWMIGIAGIIGVSALLWLGQRKGGKAHGFAAPPPPLPPQRRMAVIPRMPPPRNSIYETSGRGVQNQKQVYDTDAFAFGLKRARPGCVRC